MFLNEIEPYAADWLRALFPGAVVDQRSIVDLDAASLAGHARVHCFAGIGGWELALRLAGWPEDAPVWTGSCPCQPFSAAGRNGSVLDARHLWPAFHRLIAECRPPVVFGEQVASAAGRGWLAGVRHDLEGLGYAVGAADLCASSVGAPHIRQRVFWVADRLADAGRAGVERGRGPGDASGADEPAEGEAQQRERGRADARDRVADGGLAESADDRLQGVNGDRPASGTTVGSGVAWADADWLPCLDGKARRTQSGLRVLVDGVPFRLADGRAPVAHVSRAPLLKALGNAIVPQVAAEFVMAYMESRAVLAGEETR